MINSTYLVMSNVTVGSLNGIYGIKSPFPAPTGSATDSMGILLMKLTMNATSAKDFYLEKINVIVYSISRDPEHIRHTTFVQKLQFETLNLLKKTVLFSTLRVYRIKERAFKESIL